MAFQSIEIENFRGIEHLKVEDFKRCNLLVGENNSGKTSVLEALIFASPVGLETSIPSLNLIRGYKRTFPKFWNTYFNDSNQPLKITLYDFDKIIKKLVERQVSTKIIKPVIEYVETSEGSETSFKDFLQLKLSKKVDFLSSDSSFTYLRKWSLQESSGIKKFGSDPEWPDDILDFIHPSSFLNQLLCSQMIDRLLKLNRFNDFLLSIKNIFPQIKSIALGADSEILCNIHNGVYPLSYSALGDGTKRVITILLAMFNSPALVLSEHSYFDSEFKITIDVENANITPQIFIDEIDTGLHYEAMLDFWTAIHKAAKLLNVQVFATTHSMECVRAFSLAYDALCQDEDFGLEQDEVRAYRITRDKHDKQVARKHDQAMLTQVVQTGWDIR